VVNLYKYIFYSSSSFKIYSHIIANKAEKVINVSPQQWTYYDFKCF